ncbi:uncharacterized protein LOC109706580 [Ananas comosus]|uniref:Uncharacterized protein LOC109706580 n=1 Tax=Ananas comosus TaxID=4615 RepID=A0A6P5EI02_ANACO|nr:uncharacterized protein LOC109706580 [Ananas comosus]
MISHRHLLLSLPMTTLHQAMPNKEFAEAYEGELRTPEAHCFNFTCFWPIGLEYRQLLHEDCAKEKGSLEERGRRGKDIAAPQSVARARWKSVVHDIGRQNSNTSITRRSRRSFSYDLRSYALNFDEGDDVGARITAVGVNATRRI